MKKSPPKQTSHKEVGFLLVGVDVLGDPLRQKLIRRKQRDNPDRFLKICRGYLHITKQNIYGNNDYKNKIAAIPISDITKNINGTP